MKAVTRVAGFINGKLVTEKNLKIQYVNVEDMRRNEVLEEVRKAMWKKARYLYSMDIDTLESRRERIKSLTLIGNEIDKFIDKLKSTNKAEMGKS